MNGKSTPSYESGREDGAFHCTSDTEVEHTSCHFKQTQKKKSVVALGKGKEGRQTVE